jgi:hypothetical protein
MWLVMVMALGGAADVAGGRLFDPPIFCVVSSLGH